MTQLVYYDAARKALAKARSVDDAKNLRNQAEAARAYARQANDTQLLAHATEIKTRAERRLGELLKVAAERGERVKPSDSLKHQRSRPKTTTTLSDLGISHDLSSRAQKLAAIPAAKFEEVVAQAVRVVSDLTGPAVLKAASEPRPSARADESTPVVIPRDKPKTEQREINEIFEALETLARTNVDPATLGERVLPFQRHRITNFLADASRFVSTLKKVWPEELEETTP